MASTITQPIGVRFPNRLADELRQLAAERGKTMSELVTACVADRLPELRAASE
jgi:hypothetical protein